MIGRRVIGLLAAVVCLANHSQMGLAQSAVVERQLAANKWVQYALIWTGHYNGLTDGAIGERSISAIAAFQREHGWSATGTPTREQKRQLFDLARQNREKIGFEVIRDRKASLAIGIPNQLVPKTNETDFGTRYASRTGELEIIVGRYRPDQRTLAQLYSRVLRKGKIKTYTLKRRFRDKFFVSGEKEGTDYYYTARLDGADVVAVSVKSPKSARTWFGPIIVAIANTLHYPEASGGPVVAGWPPHEDEPANEEPKAKEEPKISLSAASGFFVDAAGHILTNDHVVGDCALVQVEKYGLAEVVQRDGTNDLAIIKVDANRPERIARFRSSELELGENVAAFGYPLTGLLGQSVKVTTGIVSSLSGIRGDSRFLQVSTPIQPGNSGGPLVDQSGRVAGVVTAKLKQSVAENIGFAHRSSVALAFLKAARLDPLTQTNSQPSLTWKEIAKEADQYTVLVYCAQGDLARELNRQTTSQTNSEATASAPAFRHGIVRRKGSNFIAPFKIKTAAGSNYFFKLINLNTKVEQMAGFIVGGTPFETKISPGLYELRYAAGDTWISEIDYFGPDTAFSKTVTSLSFTIESDIVRGVEVELILQRDGNLETRRIAKQAF